jgi:DUF1365 family protein
MPDRPFKVIYEYRIPLNDEFMEVHIETFRRETTVLHRSIEGARCKFEGASHWYQFGGPVRIVEIVDSLKSTSS